MRVPKLAALLAVVPLVLAVAACGSDDGSDVRQVGSNAGSASGSGSGSASGSGSGSASGTGSGSGISTTGLDTTSSDPLIQAAVADYTTYVNGRVDQLIARTTTFTDAVRAGNVAAAKAAFAPSREPWESIEPIAGLIPDIDGAVDSRVDDFAGPNDPAFTGWHRLEYLLWKRNTTQGGAKFANQLDADLQTLKTGLATLEIPPAAVALGASELIQEVSEGKITGEEDRYSKTDLWDFAANVAGAEEVIDDPGAGARQGGPRAAAAHPDRVPGARREPGEARERRRLRPLLPAGRRVPVEPLPDADGHEGPGRPAEGAARRAVRGPRPGARSARPRLVSHPGRHVVFRLHRIARLRPDLGDRTPLSPRVCVLAARAIRSGNAYETSEAGH